MVGVSLNNSNKADDKEQLVETNTGDVLVTVLPIKGEQDDIPIQQIEDVRRKQASILFGCLSALFMLGCLVIGTWLLFDFVNRTDHTWRRTCRFRVKPAMDKDADNRVFFDHGGLTAFDDGKNHLVPPFKKPGVQREFHQEVNVDLKKNTETIEVPQIGFTSTVRIIEDFDHNITAIRDFGVNKCFIMPLDRQHVPNPSNLIETFLAMMSGQFLPDNEVLRKTMKVQTPALTESEVALYGPVVAGTCSKDIKTYRLVAKTADEMKNRRRRRSSPQKVSSFMYSVGKRAIMFDIDH
ncbi:unnamed protein product [Adineta steineri]|uniref:Integral membrane protein 2 n=1 Tax=Adineta steineri TaxID=433720 RepID=A0A814MVW1_9BILA|nr:unnamed protein product [Adineta steineri]CAF0913962.1 unnamed protein product [Adineta steineri]CAF0972844.1 unnamed protein product [Adineta steineri]CAF1084809.1 unnamed protein product [Adineta steineri]CAF3558531.1 unnamed protein product [Adineta steineri]